VHARDCRARLVNSGGDSSFAKEKRVREAKKRKELTQETPESIKTKKIEIGQNSIGADATMKLDTSP